MKIVINLEHKPEGKKKKKKRQNKKQKTKKQKTKQKTKTKTKRALPLNTRMMHNKLTDNTLPNVLQGKINK